MPIRLGSGAGWDWIPAGCTAYPINHLSRLKKQAQITANWEALFDGGKCLFSEIFLRTISQFSLHNIRGSDEGTEMVMASGGGGPAITKCFPRA